MKSRYLHCLALLILLCTALTACSPSEIFDDTIGEIALLKTEFGEIKQFFTKFTPSTRESIYAVRALSDSEILPALDTLAHTEILDSPYVSSYWTIFDSGNPYEAENTANNTASNDIYGYTRVPLITDRRADEVKALLLAHGLTVETEIRTNPTPAGNVFALRYAGVSDENGYYINPIVPVTLYVSDQKPAETVEGRGHNFVYLTYDDGPTDEDTMRLLDILDTYGVKAAFFTTGEAVQKYPKSAKAIVERGHALGCHSVTHKYEEIYVNTAALESEVALWEQIVADAGVALDHFLFRFPGGSVGTYLKDGKSDAMTAMLEDRGYTVFDWNVVTNDSILYMAEDGTNTYDYIKENFISTFELCLRENSAKENAPIIILMHETVPETIDLMPWMLEYLINEGFIFGDLSTFGESWTFADR